MSTTDQTPMQTPDATQGAPGYLPGTTPVSPAVNQNTQDSDLTVMIPETVWLEVRGSRIEIKQIRVGQLSKIMRMSTPFYSQLQDYRGKVAKGVPVDLYSLVVENLEYVLAIIATLVEKDREWVDDLGIDEAIAIFTTILEVNLDFFLQRVFPSLSKLVGEIGGPIRQILAKQNGQIPFKP